MKQLLPTDQIAIEVPEDSINYIIDNGMQYLIYKCPNYKTWVTDDILSNPFKLEKWMKKSEKKNEPDWLNSGSKLPEGKWSILGTVTKDEIDFDTTPFIEFWDEGGGYKDYDYKKYVTAGSEYCLKTPQASFYSLLQVNGFTEFKKLLILKPNL